METFTIEQLGLFITLMAGACGGLLAVLFKSRCKNVKTPCISCDRDPLTESEIQDLEKNKPKPTPKP
tara:strand:- start:1579 stop:1779 length:201 start_codon:yes stop_codon:yes gene_type:complete